MKREDFVKVAEETLDSLPEEFRIRIQNVAILVEDFSGAPATTQSGAETAIASRHLSRRACDQEERVQPPHGIGSHRALPEEY
jgi:predicted Zn-dependent protease with MMP-like domain